MTRLRLTVDAGRVLWPACVRYDGGPRSEMNVLESLSNDVALLQIVYIDEETCFLTHLYRYDCFLRHSILNTQWAMQVWRL